MSAVNGLSDQFQSSLFFTIVSPVIFQKQFRTAADLTEFCQLCQYLQFTLMEFFITLFIQIQTQSFCIGIIDFPLFLFHTDGDRFFQFIRQIL